MKDKQERRIYNTIQQITHDKHSVSKEKRFKIDILSSRGLAQLSEIYKSIFPEKQISFEDTSHIGDKKTCDMLARGDNIGITLAESPLIRKAFIKLKPKTLYDMAVCLSIIRPAASQAKQAEAMTDLKKEFGPTYNKRLDQAKKLAVETLGSEMLNNTIMKDGSRLGDNVSVIKAFSMLADKLSEDEIIKGEGTGYVTAKEIENEISELTEDGSPYWNKTHPNHKKTVDQVFKLREQLNG